MPSRSRPSSAIALLACLALVVACSAPGEPDAGVGEPEDPAVAPEASAGDPDADVSEPDESAGNAALPPLHPAIDHLDEAMVTITTIGGDDIEVVAKVAATDTDRQRGLMEVTDLPSGTGMLFLFDAPRRGGFWMWNTRIALDIAFVAADDTIIDVATMVPCEADQPSDCPTTAPDGAYLAALEVPGGWFDEVGVAAGDTATWTDPDP